MNQILADAVLVLHFLFIAFVVAGVFLVLRWPRVAWIHLPTAIWGAVVELTGWICPLTPLENHFLESAGRSGYSGDFVEHYLVKVIYPDGLTATGQVVIGLRVVAINVGLYAVLIARRRRTGRPDKIAASRSR